MRTYVLLVLRKAAVVAVSRTVMGIDPGLAHTGWGIVRQDGSRLRCVAYGCVETDTSMELPLRLLKIKEQIAAVIERYAPSCLGIETIWFGENVSAAFGTGQARGAALVACAEAGLVVGEYTPNAIKMAVVGQGHAEKNQVQYMVAHLLGLESTPKPDHAADALAAAICFITHESGAQASAAARIAAAADANAGKVVQGSGAAKAQGAEAAGGRTSPSPSSSPSPSPSSSAAESLAQAAFARVAQPGAAQGARKVAGLEAYAWEESE